MRMRQASGHEATRFGSAALHDQTTKVTPINECIKSFVLRIGGPQVVLPLAGRMADSNGPIAPKSHRTITELSTARAPTRASS